MGMRRRSLGRLTGGGRAKGLNTWQHSLIFVVSFTPRCGTFAPASASFSLATCPAKTFTPRHRVMGPQSRSVYLAGSGTESSSRRQVRMTSSPEWHDLILLSNQDPASIAFLRGTTARKTQRRLRHSSHHRTLQRPMKCLRLATRTDSPGKRMSSDDSTSAPTRYLLTNQGLDRTICCPIDTRIAFWRLCGARKIWLACLATLPVALACRTESRPRSWPTASASEYSTIQRSN